MQRLPEGDPDPEREHERDCQERSVARGVTLGLAPEFELLRRVGRHGA